MVKLDSNGVSAMESDNRWVDGDLVEIETKKPLLTQPEVGRLLRHNNCLRDCFNSISYVKQSIQLKLFNEAKEAWIELTEEEQTAIYIAPSKGGIFTTEERKIIKSGFKEE